MATVNPKKRLFYTEKHSPIQKVTLRYIRAANGTDGLVRCYPSFVLSHFFIRTVSRKVFASTTKTIVRCYPSFILSHFCAPHYARLAPGFKAR